MKCFYADLIIKKNKDIAYLQRIIKEKDKEIKYLNDELRWSKYEKWATVAFIFICIIGYCVYNYFSIFGGI